MTAEPSLRRADVAAALDDAARIGPFFALPVPAAAERDAWVPFARLHDDPAPLTGRIAQVRDAHPDWQRRTAAAVQFQAPDYRVFSKGDLKADLLTGLGFRSRPEIAPLAAGQSDASVSPERADLLNVDKLLVFVRNPQVQQEISARPEFRAQPVVAQQRVRFLLTSQPTAAALGYGSVLSFPYVLDQLVPVLEGIPAPR